MKKAEDQKAKLEADKKGKYTDNFKCKLLDLAAELKKAEDQKAKLEQEKKCKYLDNFKRKFFVLAAELKKIEDQKKGKWFSSPWSTN